MELSIDFLPQVTEEEIGRLLRQKRKAFPAMAEGELLLGILNNQVGRAVMKRAGNDLEKAVKLVKAFPLSVTGSLGFDYAQVTKGGIPLAEVDDGLESINQLNDHLFEAKTCSVDYYYEAWITIDIRK